MTPAAPATDDGFVPRPARVLSVVFGLVLPVGCFALDPFVFTADGVLRGMLSGYRLLAYSAAGLGMASLLVWLVVGRPAGLLAGLLAGGAAFAGCVGLVLLPFSLMALVIVIGFAGLIPFGTAWVFVQNARRAWAAGGRRAGWAAVGLLIACGGPWAL